MDMNFENEIVVGVGIYTSREIADILRIPYAKVNRWINKYWDGRLGEAYQQKYSWKIDDSRAVSFHTMVEFYLMATFSDAGVRTQMILKAHQELSNLMKTAFPFATEKVLKGIRTDGKSIYYRHEDGHVISLDGTNQLNLDLIKVFFKKLDFDDGTLASRFWPLGKNKKVVCDPKIQFGAVTIPGTRIYPETLANMHKAGDTQSFIAATYDLTLKQVKDALEFSKAA